MIDRNSYLPYYLQIKNHLLESIKNNEYPLGSIIPSESALMQAFGVSRITVRQAIEALTQDGYLDKRQGKGTFVRHPKTTQELNVITSWTETMRALGNEPETRAFSASEQTVSEAMASLLKIETGERIYFIERLRYAQNEPVCIMRNYIPVKVAPGLIQKDQIRDGIYNILEGEYGLKLDSAVETIEARAATGKEAEQLDIRRGAPILIVQRVTNDERGHPIEVVTVASRADKYAYSIRLRGRPSS